MVKIARAFAVLALLSVVEMPLRAQQPQAPAASPVVMGKAIGKMVVNGTPSQTTTTIFVSNDVLVDRNTHVNVIAQGNTLVFSPGSNFQAMQNAYRLKTGGSRVASYTGMTAHLPDCFSVTPVRPDFMTVFEVDWAQGAVYVHARFQDVKIRYWMGGEPVPDKDQNPRAQDRDWIVKEGHTARINDVKLCRPLIDFWPQPNLPTALETAGATGFFVSIPFWERDSMSSVHP